MQLNITKTTIPCLRRTLNGVKEQEETLEIRLHDGMPDIDRVIACWGQPVLRSKEWRSSGICVNGGVMVWVMYIPEEGGKFQCLDAWLPFQVKFDFDDYENDGGMIIQPLIHSLDARSVSARKVMLRSVVGVSCDAMVDGEFETCTPVDVPEDVQLLQKECSFMLPKSIGEKTFRIEEPFSISEAAQAVDRVLYYQASPVVTERKIVGDKVIFRGMLFLHMLYSDTEDKLSCFDMEFPFSQFGELDSEFSADADAQIVMAVSSIDLERKENGEYVLAAGLIGQYVVFDKEMSTVVQDAYSPIRQVSATTNSLRLPVVTAAETDAFPSQLEIKTDVFHVVDAVLNPSHPLNYIEDGTLTTEVTGTYRVLEYDNDGELVFRAEKWNDSGKRETKLPVKRISYVPPMVNVSTGASGLGVRLSSEMPIMEFMYSDESMPVVVHLEVEDAVSADPHRPGLIVRRTGGESLWSIAKKTGSTVEQILEANGLQEEPEADRILLIPIV